MDADFSPEFSAKLAARGWVGMAIPTKYGGHDRSAVDRFIVIEELLAAGAPIWAHWIADRQTGPTLLAYGTEAQRERFLPSICAGRCFFSIGLSEPDAGSDLASVRTTATRTEGGWLVNGTKVWTSGAHQNHWFAVLCRTSALADDRHSGLSQLLVDLRSPGLTINPIPFLDGSHHFNEVVFQDVFVPDDLLLGEEGMGWGQVTSELAFERAGPDRFMSCFLLLSGYLREHNAEQAAEVVGRLTARFWTIRQMSLSVASAIDAGQSPEVEAAVVKDLGTAFEQDVVATLAGLIDQDPDPDGEEEFERLLARAVLISPAFTIRGGTTEILRSVVARGMRR
jgi:alkylation response protein AidB-like acyl-CoA dehydrogenase